MKITITVETDGNTIADHIAAINLVTELGGKLDQLAEVSGYDGHLLSCTLGPARAMYRLEGGLHHG